MDIGTAIEPAATPVPVERIVCRTRAYVGAVAIGRDGRVVPERTFVRCEAPGCDVVLRMADAVSLIGCVAMPGIPGLGAFVVQCGEEQHFCCSPACAAKAHMLCTANHVYPALEALHEAARTGVLTTATLGGVTLRAVEAADPETKRTLRALEQDGRAVAKPRRTRQKRIAGSTGHPTW